MSHLSEQWAVPWLIFLAGWSIRWGIVLAALAAWFALRPPRRVATRYGLCLASLGAGVLMPLSPRWGNAAALFSARSSNARAEGEPRSLSDTIVHERDDRDAGSSASAEYLPAADPTHRRDEGEDLRPESQRSSISPLNKSASTRAIRCAILSAAAVWGVISIVMSLRLARGWSLLRRLRRESSDVTTASALLDECRRSVNLTRPARLATHPSAASPIVVGGLRPVVLVPYDWERWDHSQRRACLLHELSHLARYDDAAKLFQELIRPLFFFHPLVAWLLGRLDREREFLCDEFAVALGCDPIAYARFLFDLSRRPSRLVPDRPFPSHGWLPFFDRRTVGVRIDRLLEEDMPRNLPASCTSPILLLTRAIAVGLGVGGITVRAMPSQDPARPTKPDPVNQRAAVAAKASVKFRGLRGVVRDTAGKPIPDATIVVGRRDLGKNGRETVRTDASGKFIWRAPEDWQEVCLVAHKAGWTAWASQYWLDSPHDPGEVKLQLSKPELFAATLQDEEGKPVAGARLQVRMVVHASATESTTSVWYEHVTRSAVEGSAVEEVYATTTNALGTFRFSHFAPGSGLMLEAVTADGRLFRVKPQSIPTGNPRQMLNELGFVDSPPGTWTRLVAVPAARIAGQVLSKVPGLSTNGVKVCVQGSNSSAAYQPILNQSGYTLTDSEGHFGFDGLAEGTVNIVAFGPGENETWTCRAAKDIALKPGATSEVSLELTPGVEVEGRVVEVGTGKPLGGASIGVHGPSRPRSNSIDSAMPLGLKTDAKGRYHCRLPSGEAYIYVMSAPEGYVRLRDDQSSRTVKIPDGMTNFHVPNIDLAPAVTLRGKVLDNDGNPIEGASVVGTGEGELCLPFAWGLAGTTDSRGEFRLKPGLNNTLPVGRTARLQIRLPGGSEHEVTANPSDDGSVVIRLPKRLSTR